MEDNNSPDPIFDTDGQSSYFLAILPACTSSNDQVDDQGKVLVIKQIEDVLALCNCDGDQVSDQVSAVVNTTIHSSVSDVLHLFLNSKKKNRFVREIGNNKSGSATFKTIQNKIIFHGINLFYL